MTPKPVPPLARIERHRVTQHGVTRIDPYAWLRDPHWQEVMRDPARLSPEIRAHLEAENAHTDAVMADLRALEAALYAEMRGRIKEEDESVPMPDGLFAYLVRYETGGQYPKLLRENRAGGGRRLLFDGDAEAAGSSYFALGALTHSPDHRLIAYSLDRRGSEYYTIHLREAATLRPLADEVTDTDGGLAFAPDGRSFLYVRRDASHRPTQLYRHVIGEPQERDVLLYAEEDPAFVVGVSLSESRAYFHITAEASETSEHRLLRADDPLGAQRIVLPRSAGHKYDVSHQGRRIFIVGNDGGKSEDFRILEASLENPDPRHWREVVPHERGRLVLGLSVFERHLVRHERARALPRIVVTAIGRDGGLGPEASIDFPEEAYALGVAPSHEYATSTLRYVYSSPTTPRQVFDHDMATGRRLLRKTDEIPSGHDPDRYVARRLWVASHDGTQVPVTVLHARTTPLDGSAPILLYGYGSYGSSVPAGFSAIRLSLVDRGFVFAIAHVRGGKDLGYHWYTDGKLLNKKNSFLDFIAAAEGLAARGYGGRGRIIAQGGSAGGLLVGAAANMAPEGLLLGVIAEVPFVDVLNTMSDASLPLTPPEWTEWGDPVSSPEAFAYIASYSPYDNLAPRAYPHVLATAGLTDPRVTYWEPAKWIARLRATRRDEGLTLLRTVMEAGHGGASGRFEQLKEEAFITAFALKIAGKA